MKKIRSAVSFLLTVILCALTFSSCFYGDGELRSGDYRYTVENGEVTITQYVGKDAEITVPESIEDLPVVAIADSAFFNCDSIRSVTFPDSVTRIGSLVFSKCDALEQVTLGRGVREIDFSPFAFCEKMTYHEYENGYYIGSDENPYLALVSAVSEDIETITVHPDTVVVCGSSLDRCFKLREVTFPSGVVSIGWFTFNYCSSLETVYLPESVESIGGLVFQGCDSLMNIVVSDENSHYKSVDGSLFSRDGTRLIRYTVGQENSSYRVPNGTVSIESYAFENAKHLTEVVLADSVEEIGHSAFLDCKKLRTIDFGNSLKSIGGQAFGFCDSLTQITIPDSVEELSYSIFSSCKNLETAVIGSGVTYIDTEIFSGCNALREVTFRDPEGWRIKTMYALFSKKIDLSDPKQNAEYLVDKYSHYYWLKD